MEGGGAASGLETVQSAITGMASSVATAGQTTLGSVVTTLAPLIAAILVAYLGYRLVKRFGK